MKRPKMMIVIAILIGIFILIGRIIWILSFGFLPNPPKPQITYGEFPFELIYEINGETKTVNDDFVCEYGGVAVDAANGKFRWWKSYLKSGNTRITLLKNDETEIFYTPDINQHAAPVYMGDTEIYHSINEVFPNALYTSDFENKQVNSYIISADEMWEKYKLKLISWKIEPPIKNTFK